MWSRVSTGRVSTRRVAGRSRRPSSRSTLTNDIAVLRVRGLGARPLPAAGPERGVAIALAGYPRNGPLTRTPARLGGTAEVLSRDAYGSGPVRRQVTAIRGVVEPGSSGGPGIDAQGRVRTTVFARRPRETGGYGIPIELVTKVVRRQARGRSLRRTARASTARPRPQTAAFSLHAEAFSTGRSAACGCRNGGIT